MNKKWDRLSDEEKRDAKQALIDFFDRERGERIGVIAAEDIMNFFLEEVGSKLYNKGIEDARKAMESRMDEIRYDLDDLKEY